MDIESTYQKIIASISQGHRGLQRFSPDEVTLISEKLERALAERNLPDLEKLLCLIEHSASLEHVFAAPLERALTMDLPDRVLIFVLNCARKHLIEAKFQLGRRLNFEFLEVLKRLLYSPSPEVVEWTLRTIVECGPQGIYFSQEFDKIKPPPWKWFNPHQRAVREIIALLEHRWRKV